MFFVTAGFIAVLSSVAVPNDDEVKHTKDSYEKIMENLEQKKAVMVDVREKNEWDAGHLAGAKLIPWSKIRFASSRKKLKELPDDDLIVYCHCKAGVRALRAAKKLKEIGYDVRPLKAGFEELVENGFEKAKKKK
ncbi:MAG: rhodanese-like domain-containing protein [Planctomycetota bacterium]|nr:rhodanese-like domain-containing protein [Planctomycetota bacterium]